VGRRRPRGGSPYSIRGLKDNSSGKMLQQRENHPKTRGKLNLAYSKIQIHYAEEGFSRDIDLRRSKK